MDPAAVLGRFLDRPRVAYVRAVLDAYGEAPGGLLASGLAFSALFAIVPITVLTVGLAGWLADDETIQQALVIALVSAFPPLATLIDQALEALIEGAAVTSFIGLLATIWTVSQFYAALDMAVARVFGRQPGRTAVRRTVRSFAWVAVLIGLVVGYIVAVSLTSTLSILVPDSIRTLRLVADVLGSPVTAFTLIVVVLVLLYRTVPPYTPRWTAAALPGLVIGIAIVLLTQVFALFAPRIVGVAAIVGSLAVVFIALAWLSFLFQLLLVGAAWVRVRQEGPTVATNEDARRSD
jgi:membrane protein